MHRGYSIQNCTLQALCDRVSTFFLLFVSYVILKLIKSHTKFICGSGSNVLKMFRVSF